MSVRAFLDTNVALYAFAIGDPKRSVAQALLGSNPWISVQVLNEFAAVAHRKHHLPWPRIVEALGQVQAVCAGVLPVTIDMHRRAVDLAERHRLRIYDACILAAALEADCATLYSEDMHHGLVVDGRLTVVNPFRQPPEGVHEAAVAYGQ